MNNEQITQLISEYWSDEYLISGKENVKNIVEDALAGNASEKNFIAPAVGDNFDITFSLEIVLSAAQLIIAIYQVLQDSLQTKKQNDYLVSEAAMRAVVENYANVWDFLSDEQKADFIDSLLRLMRNK